jgi:hypothetical protein
MQTLPQGCKELDASGPPDATRKMRMGNTVTLGAASSERAKFGSSSGARQALSAGVFCSLKHFDQKQK